jgi:hypothetical protein
VCQADGTLNGMPLQQASGPTPRRGFRGLPAWLQFSVTLGIGAIVIVAVVLYVHHVGNDSAQEAPVTSPKAVKEENREANILVRQDQAPHHASLGPGSAAADGLRAAVLKYMRHQINIGVISGPVTKSSCVARSGSTSTRQSLRCDVTAADVTYPFYGVVEPKSGQITYCKKDQPPIPSMNVPLSARCL